MENQNNIDNMESGHESRFTKMTRTLSARFASKGRHPKERPTSQPELQPHRKISAPGPTPKKLDVDNWVKKPSRETCNLPKPAKPKNGMVGEKMSIWLNKQKQHEEKQALNPFSEHFDKSKVVTMDKNDPNYGRPPEDSLTAARARAGEARLISEIVDVCDVIFHQGTKMEDGTAAITFGQLFQIYNSINDKVVGLLLRARKKEYLTFEGEMLFQRRDDDKWIELLKTINTIHKMHGRDADMVGGGEVDVEEDEDQAISASDSITPMAASKTFEKTPSEFSTKQKTVNSIRSSFRKMTRPFVKKRVEVEDGKDCSTDDEEAWGGNTRRASRKSLEKLPKTKGVLGRLSVQDNKSDSSGEFLEPRHKEQASPSPSQHSWSRKRLSIRRESMF